MPLSPADALTVLDRGLDLLEGLLQRTRKLGERAAGVAETLRALVPDAGFCACRLTQDGQASTAIVDRAGAEQPESLLDELSSDQGHDLPTREILREGRRWLVQE